MDKFEAMQRFVAVAQSGSFTRAADLLDLPKSSISNAVQSLEKTLATRLLHRSTRSVTLTQDGEVYLQQCRSILRELDAVESQFRQADEIRGVLRVDMPSRFASTIVLPHLAEWLERYPQVKIKISSADYQIDPVKEGVDCLIRVGELQDSQLIAKPLCKYQIYSCASPCYLQRYGEPKQLNELAKHYLIDYAPKMGNSAAEFEYLDKGQRQVLAMPSRLAVNGTDAYMAACEAGLGIIQVPALGAALQLKSGAIKRILPAIEVPPMPVSILYSSRRQLPQRLSLFMEWLQALVKRLEATSSI
jgi:DNA-binding transcriptional LysR family regulator